MIPKISLAVLLLIIGSTALTAQSNTAVTSGSIGKCAVWNYPNTLYNNAGATQNINNGVTVTVDQNRNIGAVNLSGSGALNMSGANGITFSGSGAETVCRFILNPSKASLYSINGSTDTATYFTAPVAGNYTITLNSHYQSLTEGGYPYYVAVFNGDYSKKLFQRSGPADSLHLGPLTYTFSLAAGESIYLMVQACSTCVPTSSLNVTLSSAYMLNEN